MNLLRLKQSVVPSLARRTLLTLLLALPLHGQATTAWVVSSSEKVLPGASPGTAGTSPGTAGTAGSATLTAARNEFESFQVALVGPASAVSVTAGPLTGPGTIPAPRLYREALIQLTHASGPDGATGPFPDALVPDVDDVVGEKRNAFPFDVPPGEARAVLVELHVPADAPAGRYQGSVVVHAAGQPDLAIPVALTVWDFALPSTSSLRSHFGLYYGDLMSGHGISEAALPPLRARYAQLGLDHRISIGGVDDGNRSLTHFAQYYGALVDGTAPTQLAGARLTSVQVVGAQTTADYASWASFFRARGWFDRLFDYTCDEPPATCAWSDIPARNAIIKAADPELRTLVTTDVQDAAAQGVLASIDIVTPVLNWMDDKPGMTFSGVQRPTYDAFLAGGQRKELWMYQSCMSHGCGGTNSYFAGWASYAIDASAVRARAMEWLSFRWGVTGELYWETTFAYTADGSAPADPWSDQWRFTGNGDGTLLYPGTPARIGGVTDIPVASLRLKMIREGMEDFEYLKALSDAGDPLLAQQLAASLFPDPWTMPSPDALLAAREQIARRIVALTHPAGPADGTVASPDPTPAPTDPTAAPAPAPAATVGPPVGSDALPAAPAGGASPPDATLAATPAPVLASSTSVGGCTAGGAGGELLAGLGIWAAALLRRRRGT